jgi:hypothetical protein
MKTKLIFLCALVIFAMSSCSVVKDGKPTIKQGVYGRVLWLEGNVMPSTDGKSTNAGIPARRTINVYKTTHLNETVGQSPLFDQIKTALVATVKTDANGNFQCELPVGKYAIFTVEEGNQFFANLFDGDGAIAPFEVKAGQLTNYSIQINYKAFY